MACGFSSVLQDPWISGNVSGRGELSLLSESFAQIADSEFPCQALAQMMEGRLNRVLMQLLCLPRTREGNES